MYMKTMRSRICHGGCQIFVNIWCLDHLTVRNSGVHISEVLYVCL